MSINVLNKVLQTLLINPIVAEYNDSLTGLHVIKYANGRAEVYGNIAKTESTSYQSASMYFTQTHLTLPDIFTELPTVNITCRGTLGGYVYIYNLTVKQIDAYLITEAKRTNIAVQYMLSAIGRWK